MSAVAKSHKNVAPRLDTQIPEHIRADSPAFLAFMKAYYEYLGRDNNVLNASRRLTENMDPDETLQKFLIYFTKEFIPTLPKGSLVDKSLLLKHAREFYRTRGSEASYKLLFRIMWNEEIDFYYPGEDILRASDGRYQITKSIKVSNVQNGEAISFDGVQIEGKSSGARARVLAYVETEVAGVYTIELKVTNIIGVFTDGEEIETEDKVTTATILNTVGPISATETIRTAGAWHQSGDIVNIIDSGSGSGANAVITGTTGDSAVYATISNAGSGYRANSIVQVTHNGGVGFNFRIDEINNTELLDGLNSDTIEAYANIPLNTNANTAWRGHAGANTAAMNAPFSVTNVNSTFVDAFSYVSITTGSIKKITTTDFGYGYQAELPIAHIEDNEIAGFKVASSANPGLFKGNDAEITVNRAPGSISEIEINDQGSDYSKFRDVFIRNATRGSADGGYVSDTVDGNIQQTTAKDATASAKIYGIIDNPGVFTDTKGFLSWNNKMQDNFYYQEYSYAIKSSQYIDTYRKIINDLLHPAGTKMFNLFQADTILDASTTSVDLQANRLITIELDMIQSTGDSLDDYTSSNPGAITGEIVRDLDAAMGGTGEFVVQSTIPTLADTEITFTYVFIIEPMLTFSVKPSIDTQEIESELQVPLVSTEMARHLQVETESFNTQIIPHDVQYSYNEIGLRGRTLVETLASGQLFNNLAETIASQGSSTVAGIGAVPVGEIGSGRLLYGNNTSFTSELNPGDSILMVSNTTNSTLGSGTANNIFVANTIFSDELLSITTEYPYKPASNVQYYYYS